MSDDEASLLNGILDGRVAFAASGWDEGARIYHLVERSGARPLTAAERNVVALVARGAANEEAGFVLGVGATTVSGHLANVARQLDARVLDLLALGPLFEALEVA